MIHNKPRYIGIWLNQQVELVWLDQYHTPQLKLLPLDQIEDCYLYLAQQLNLSYKKIKKSSLIQWVTAILPQYIWSKTLIFPHLLNPQECEQQTIYTLQKELPLALEQVWYDYHYSPLHTTAKPFTHSSRLDIFAVTTQQAQQYLQQFSSLSITILDHFAYVLLRGFYYLCPEQQQNPNVLWLYQDQQQIIAIQNKSHQLQVLQKTTTNITALIQDYELHYPNSATNYVLYRTPDAPSSSIPQTPQWQLLTTHLPLIALGCALWGMPDKGNHHE